MTHRVLLVANRTLGSDEVVTAVRERIRAGATELWIVAPVSPTRGQAGASMTGLAGAGEAILLRDQSPDDQSYDAAQRRLDEALLEFGRLGITAGGEVGDVDPFRAVSKVMRTRTFDEVVISTLPKPASHWLRVDLPSRVHRKFKVPVTTVASRER